VSQDPAERAVQKDKGWRSASADWIARAHSLIAHLDDEYAQGRSPAPLVINPPGKEAFKASDVVRRLLHLLDSLQHNLKAEERAAWDQYYAACRVARPRLESPEELAREATRMLDERRKAFQRPVEDPKGGDPR
jgi:hypothetical protein